MRKYRMPYQGFLHVINPIKFNCNVRCARYSIQKNEDESFDLEMRSAIWLYCVMVPWVALARLVYTIWYEGLSSFRFPKPTHHCYHIPKEDERYQRAYRVYTRSVASFKRKYEVED